jgi:hypothetical protein
VSTAATLGICGAIILIGGGAIYLASKSIKPPVTAVIQSPSLAVAGANALAQLGSHAIDAWISNKSSKAESED